MFLKKRFQLEKEEFDYLLLKKYSFRKSQVKEESQRPKTKNILNLKDKKVDRKDLVKA